MNKLIPIYTANYYDNNLPLVDKLPLHTCPYREDIHGDYETLCDCDEEQLQNCAADI